MSKRAKILTVVLLGFSVCCAFARLFQIIAPEKLFADSKLVFIGRVKSIKPSGITTRLGYPAWENVTFEWLSAEVEVLEAFKGVEPSSKLTTLFLSEKEPAGRMYSPPGMVDPNPGDVFLFCLGPTPIAKSYASLTGPWDDYLSIITLHRDVPLFIKSQDDFLVRRKDFQAISNLVDATGNISASGVKSLREKYAREFATKSSRMIYLEWESRTNRAGWQTDFPKAH